MKKQEMIAQNEGRFYRVSMSQMRYFRIGKAEAELKLATGAAREVPYFPFSRPELYEAFKVAQAAIDKAKKAIIS